MSLKLQKLCSNTTKTLLIRSMSHSSETGNTPFIKNNVSPSVQGSSQVTKVDVPGLSVKCIKNITGPVGPGAKVDGEYKVPEYFSYNNMTYYEAEIEMLQFRCPQPKAI